VKQPPLSLNRKEKTAMLGARKGDILNYFVQARKGDILNYIVNDYEAHETRIYPGKRAGKGDILLFA